MNADSIWENIRKQLWERQELMRLRTEVLWMGPDICGHLEVLRKAKSIWSDSLKMALEVNAMQKGLVAMDVGGARFHAQQVCIRSCPALRPPAPSKARTAESGKVSLRQTIRAPPPPCR